MNHDDLKRAVRALEPIKPPPSVDAAIRQAARAALPSTRRRPARFLFPLATAAVLVLGFGVVLLQPKRAAIEPPAPTESAPSAVSADAAPAADDTQHAAVPMAEAKAIAAEPQAASTADALNRSAPAGVAGPPLADSARQQAPASELMVSAERARSAPVTQASPAPPPPPPPAAAGESIPWPTPQTATDALAQPSAASPPAPKPVLNEPFPAPASTAPLDATSERRAAESSDPITVAIERLRALKASKRIAEFRAARAQFQRDFPNVDLPPDLRE
jgi:hypothetical protein